MRKPHHIIFGKRGAVALPGENVALRFNPIERTLYRLFTCHPEGIAADQLPSHWLELSRIYAKESCFDDTPLRVNALESLCDESKIVFYSNISRIKKKFVDALGARKAMPYIIKRDKAGLYRTRATLE